MGNYRSHRERRGRRADEDADYLSERTSEASYFQRPPLTKAQPVEAEVVWFNESKGFGFVKSQDGAEAYLQIRTLETVGRSSVSEGTPLKVIVGENQRGRQVAQVLEIGEAPSGKITHARPTRTASCGSDIAGETTGKVNWYSSEKGFGFIAPEGGGRDVFVHATALSRSGITALVEGQQVLMECGQGKKGLEVRTLRLA